MEATQQQLYSIHINVSKDKRGEDVGFFSDKLGPDTFSCPETVDSTIAGKHTAALLLHHPPSLTLKRL